jgi:hypothetical protein
VIIGSVTTPEVVAGSEIAHDPAPLERTYPVTAGEAETLSKTTLMPFEAKYAFLITGAAGTEKVFAVTCGEVSTTNADVASATALAIAESRRRREGPRVFEFCVCVITGGYWHVPGYKLVNGA